MLIQTKQPSTNVRAKEESCKASDSGQESESARDSPAVVRGSVGPQHWAPVPGLARFERVLLSFSSLADYSGTMPAFALFISHSAEHGQ